MKKNIFLVGLLSFIENVYAQFAKYYSDEVGPSNGSGELGFWLIIIAFVGIFVISSKSTRRSLIYFLALFVLPLIFGKIGFMFGGILGGLVGGLLGCYLWFRLGSWLDKE
jgi:hypothetical protein